MAVDGRRCDFFIAINDMNKQKWIALMSLFIDSLGFIIIIPVLPNLLDFYQTNYFMMSL